LAIESVVDLDVTDRLGNRDDGTDGTNADDDVIIVKKTAIIDA
jgi:hypothetical protein